MVPPFLLTPACTERVEKVVWTCVGEVRRVKREFSGFSFGEYTAAGVFVFVCFV